MKNKLDSITLRAVLKNTLPVLAGYFVMGMAFGMALHETGFEVGWAASMALTVYSGSLQFVGIDLLAQATPLISAALMCFLVNARYMMYGVSMLDKFRHIGRIRPLMIFWLTDETYALLCMEPPAGVNKKVYSICVALFDHCYWIIGCVTGSLLGQIIPFSTEGVDFAMTALFTVTVVDQWQNSRDHIPAIIGGAVSVVSLLIFGKDNFLIPAMLGIVALLAVRMWRQNRRAAA